MGLMHNMSSDSMELLTDVSSLASWRQARYAATERVGFVPTMGALHAGHLALIQAAKVRTDRVVASIFVNPTQFGPQEDFARYPKTLEQDRELLAKAGCDALFVPEVGAIYPSGFQTSVRVESLAGDLCGRIRPGHFDGVAVVVTILLNLVRPEVAFFGLKDYQQFLLIQRLTLDLAMSVEVVGVPTVREADGLALSSRNRYLNDQERQQAAWLYQALLAAKARLGGGERDPVVLEGVARDVLQRAGLDAVEYVALRDAKTLLPVERVVADAVLLLAVRVGPARLIDNMVLSIADCLG